jgi:hypothetical protein
MNGLTTKTHEKLSAFLLNPAIATEDCLEEIIANSELRNHLIDSIAATKDQYLRYNTVGFFKRTVVEGASLLNDRELRMHIYDPNMFCNDETRHSHAWKMSSRIILGGLKDTRYALSDSGQPDEYVEISSRSFTEKRGVFYDHYKGGAYIRESEVLTFKKNDLYSMDENVFHKTEPLLNQLTATLVLRDPFKDEWEQILPNEKTPAQPLEEDRPASPHVPKSKLPTLGMTSYSKDTGIDMSVLKKRVALLTDQVIEQIKKL